MTNALIKIRNLVTQTHTQVECHVNMMADWVMHLQAKPKIANKLPEARKEDIEDIIDSHNSQKGAICQDIDLRLLALRTVGQ